VTYRTDRYELLREIGAGGLPWPVPELLDHGVVDGVHYAVETRLPGRSLDRVLPELAGERRDRALANYADGALRIREARVDRPWFGELYYDPSVRDASWPAYLAARARLHVEKAGDTFAAEVPGLGRILDRFEEDARAVALALEGVEPGLVHGDYFPPNVLVSDDLEITAVVDFGWSTLVGDPRLDAVCASTFLEVDRTWCTPADAAFVRRHIAERNPSVVGVFDLYRTYCALHFSFVIHYGIPLARWCARTLREERP
jgi:hypothetical protein